MGVPAIKLENVGKRYRIGPDRAGYRTLRESLMDLATAPIRRLKTGSSAVKMEDFWALSEVNLEIGHGEIVGVIGSNGAGKSTLLKILSRITKPTLGRVTMNGR